MTGAASSPERPAPPVGFRARAVALTDRTFASFPVRVWQRFNRRNGLLLAAGTSDQAVFAVFAAVYVAFAVVGIWLGSSREAIDGLIAMVHEFAPGLISWDGHAGLVSPDRIREVATGSAGVLGITGIVAVIALGWTAVGWVTFLRSAVRDILSLPPVDAHFALVKVWDFIAAVVWALLLLLGGTLSAVGASALSLVFDVFGVDSGIWVDTATRILSLLIAFGIDVLVLVSLYRFLAATDLPWRRVLPASAAAGAALVVLQVTAGLLIGRAQFNPLVATFVLILGLLFWFRLAMIVILLGAAWVAESASDRDIAVVVETEHDRQVAEAESLLTAANVRLREARAARERATWVTKNRTIRSVKRAREEVRSASERLERARRHQQEARAAQRKWWSLRHGGMGEVK